MTRDVQLDMSEIILERQVYCFNCKILMKKISEKVHRCESCGETYTEE